MKYVDLRRDHGKNRGKYGNYMDLKFFLEDSFKRKVDLVVIEAIKSDLKPYIFGSVKYAARI